MPFSTVKRSHPHAHCCTIRINKHHELQPSSNRYTDMNGSERDGNRRDISPSGRFSCHSGGRNFIFPLLPTSRNRAPTTFFFTFSQLDDYFGSGFLSHATHHSRRKGLRLATRLNVLPKLQDISTKLSSPNLLLLHTRSKTRRNRKRTRS